MKVETLEFRVAPHRIVEILSLTQYSQIMLSQAEIEISKVPESRFSKGIKSGTCKVTPNLSPLFNHLVLMEALYQTGVVLGLNLFPESKNVRMESVNLHLHERDIHPAKLLIAARFIKTENDSNSEERRTLCFLNVTAHEGNDIIADGVMSIMFIEPRKQVTASFPLSQGQINDGMGKLAKINASAIIKACKEGPRPGYLGCD